MYPFVRGSEGREENLFVPLHVLLSERSVVDAVLSVIVHDLLAERSYEVPLMVRVLVVGTYDERAEEVMKPESLLNHESCIDEEAIVESLLPEPRYAKPCERFDAVNPFERLRIVVVAALGNG